MTRIKSLIAFIVVCTIICPTIADAQKGCDIFVSYSDFGDGNARTNTELNASVGDTVSAYVWVGENLEIDTGMFLNARSSTPGVIQFTGAQVFEPAILVAGTPVNVRWSRTNFPTINNPDFVEHLDAVVGCSGNATGILTSQISNETPPNFLVDALHDSSAGTNAFLYARVDFVVLDTSASTEISCETGCGLIVNDNDGDCVALSPGYCSATVSVGTACSGDPIRTTQISPTTSIPVHQPGGGVGPFSIDQIVDGIVSDAFPFNGFVSLEDEGIICLELDQEYNLESFSMWNDVSVSAEGVRDFCLSFYDESGDLITTLSSSMANGPFVGALGQEEVEEYVFDAPIKCVKKVELIVKNVYANNFGIEIREVEFCGTPCECKFESDNVLCDLDGEQLTGDFVVTGMFTNLQDIPGTHLLLPTNATSPDGVELCFGSGGQVLAIDPPVNNGESVEVGSDLSNADAIIVKNALPGDEVCFSLVLFGEGGQECCSVEVCFEMPPCNCLQVDRRLDEITDVICNDDGSVDFSYTFQLTNLYGQDVYHTFLGALGSETFTPDYFDLVTLNSNLPLGQGQSVLITTRITSAQPEVLVNFLITLHLEDFSECCTRQHDVLAPECPKILKGDVNCDGVVNLLDVSPFIQVLSSGVYDPKADINCDGVVNLLDVSPFIQILSGG